MEKVLVTGGAGFIGSHLIEGLISEGNAGKIVVVDDLSSGRYENLPDSETIEFIRGDISNPEVISTLFQSHKFGYIYHLAGISSVQESVNDPIRAHTVNFESTLRLIEAARKTQKLERFVFASSAAVYGKNPHIPASETDAVFPVTPYGVDKYAAERTVINAWELYRVPGTVFRFFNVYGPRQNPNSPYSGVISILTDRVMNAGGVFKLYGDGTQSRDFIFVKDLIDMVLSITQMNSSVGQVYNSGTGISVSLAELIGIIENKTGARFKIERCPARMGDIVHSLSSIEKARASGYLKNMTGINAGLEILIDDMNKPKISFRTDGSGNDG